ncbi:hypothetical protein BC828DRAFT_389031 [Blastocladiella britannica]|nr:hypothetical protein BC828DRAFT_389031 [Blastocladiella britannica]
MPTHPRNPALKSRSPSPGRFAHPNPSAPHAAPMKSPRGDAFATTGHGATSDPNDDEDDDHLDSRINAISAVGVRQQPFRTHPSASAAGSDLAGETHVKPHPYDHQYGHRGTAAATAGAGENGGDQQDNGTAAPTTALVDMSSTTTAVGASASASAKPNNKAARKKKKEAARARLAADAAALIEREMAGMTIAENKADHPSPPAIKIATAPRAAAAAAATSSATTAAATPNGPLRRGAASDPPMEYALRESWKTLYPVEVMFRPYYSANQMLPIPMDGFVTFSSPWLPSEWDADLVPDPTPMTIMSRLSEELQAFSTAAAPHDNDLFLRQLTMQRLRQVAEPLMPEGSQLTLFGSSASPAANKSSDLDVGILPPNSEGIDINNGRLAATKILRKVYTRFGLLAERGSMEFVSRTKVPLIKYTDRVTGLEVDLSLQWDGFETVDIVNRLADRYPSLVPIVRAIKAMLSLHGLNKARDGGMHGFCVLCMVVAVLGRLEAIGTIPVTREQYLANKDVPTDGFVFMTILFYFGFVFDPATTGLDNTNGGAIFQRHPLCDQLYDEHLLVVTSVRPQSPPENVGRSVSDYTWSKFRAICQLAISKWYQCGQYRLAVDPARAGAITAMQEEQPDPRGAPVLASTSLLGMIVDVPEAYMAAEARAFQAVHLLDERFYRTIKDKEKETITSYEIWSTRVLDWQAKVLAHSIQSTEQGQGRGRGGGNGGGGRHDQPRQQQQQQPTGAAAAAESSGVDSNAPAAKQRSGSVPANGDAATAVPVATADAAASASKPAKSAKARHSSTSRKNKAKLHDHDHDGAGNNHGTVESAPAAPPVPTVAKFTPPVPPPEHVRSTNAPNNGTAAATGAVSDDSGWEYFEESTRPKLQRNKKKKRVATKRSIVERDQNGDIVPPAPIQSPFTYGEAGQEEK